MPRQRLLLTEAAPVTAVHIIVRRSEGLLQCRAAHRYASPQNTAADASTRRSINTRLRTRIATAGTALALISAVGVLPGAAAANAAPTATGAVPHAQPAAATVPVTGTLADSTAFNGELSNVTTSVVNGVLTLTGTITGTGIPGGTSFSTPIQVEPAEVEREDLCSRCSLRSGWALAGPETVAAEQQARSRPFLGERGAVERQQMTVVDRSVSHDRRAVGLSVPRKRH